MQAEFPKRILVVMTATGLAASEGLDGFESEDLPDGAGVAIYRLSRVKKVAVSRKLVKSDGESDGEDPEDGNTEDHGPAEPGDDQAIAGLFPEAQ